MDSALIIILLISWAMSLVLAFFMGFSAHATLCQKAKAQMVEQVKNIVLNIMENVKNGRSKTSGRIQQVSETRQPDGFPFTENITNADLWGNGDVNTGWGSLEDIHK